MPIVQKQSGRLNITIPSKLAKAKNIQKGDKLEWKINDQGNLELLTEEQ